jgi:hypothetical protein
MAAIKYGILAPFHRGDVGKEEERDESLCQLFRPRRINRQLRRVFRARCSGGPRAGLSGRDLYLQGMREWWVRPHG